MGWFGWGLTGLDRASARCDAYSMIMRHLSYLALSILFAGSVMLFPGFQQADGMCTERPVQPAEVSILTKAREAVLAFLPESNEQWSIVEEFIQEVPSEVCREHDVLPLQSYSVVRYLKAGQEQRDKESEANMEQAADRIKQAEQKNRIRLDQIDRELEALTEQVEQAAQRQDINAIQRISQKTQALMEEKNRLMQASETMDNLESSETEAKRDTRVSLEVSVNPVYFSFVHATKTVPLVGADAAVMMVTPGPVKNGENAEMVILLGRWQSNGSDRWASVFDAKIPRTRIQTIAVRILADEQRLMPFAQKLPLRTLRALIGQ